MATMKLLLPSPVLTLLSGPPQRHLASIAFVPAAVAAHSKRGPEMCSLSLSGWTSGCCRSVHGWSSKSLPFGSPSLSARIDSAFLFTHTAVHGA